MMWLIIRTDHAKEHYVAQQIQNLGFDAWVPCQIIVTRPAMSRRAMAVSNARKVNPPIPLIPRLLFARASAYEQSALKAIRHCKSIDQYPGGGAVCLSDAEIARFRAAIDAENTSTLALAQRASKKQKAKWRALKEAILDWIDSAKEQLERAA